jgi:hypothetical protein
MNFHAWLRRREIPDADRLFALVQAAGRGGIPEGELRASVDLPRRLLDGLLTAMVSSGVARVVERGGKRVY